MSIRHSRKFQLALICSACTALVLTAYLFAVGGYDFAALLRWEMQLRNVLVRQGHTTPADPRLMYLAIDNDSVSIDGVDLETLFSHVKPDSADFRALSLISRQWPWPREIYALILDKLFAAGAQVVAIDLMFPKPSADDDAFRAALDRYKDRVVIGSNFVPVTLPNGAEAWEHTPPAATLIPQTEPLDDRVAYVNIWTDGADQVIRRARLRTTLDAVSGFPPNADSEVMMSLAARTITKAGMPELVPPGNEVRRLFRFADAPGIGFRPKSIFHLFVPRYWAANFQNGENLRGKIIVIGPSGSWQHDEHPTPYGAMPGPELHLNAMNALLHGAFLGEAPLWVECVLVLLGGFAAWLISLLTPRPALQILRGLTATAAGALLALGAYNYLNLYTACVTPLLALNLSGGCCFVYEFVAEQIDKARVRRTLERYVSKDVVRELIDNRESVLNSLEGAHKPVTVLFSDLRGFTSRTEGSDAVRLVRQLNEYFNRMVRIVFANTGTLDKFIGDGLMAHWGSIVSNGEASDASKAVSAALQMRAALASLNDEWRARGWSGFDFGIGINSGDAIVGNLGCEEKMEVTVLGDAVNLASRIEGATKQYHVDLLIGSKVAELVRESCILRTVDIVRVSGKSQAVELFTVIGERAAGQPEAEWLAIHEDAIRLYRGREFAQSIARFAEVGRLRPDDWLSGEYLRRARLFEAKPPGPDWTGVHVLTGK